MIPSARLAGLLSCAALSATAWGAADAIPPARSYCKKMFSMPAFFQRDSRFGELPGGGEKYCAPVAASNALVWLGRNGYPGLLPAREDVDRAQFEMIRLLGSASYMKTSARRGSHPLDMMGGLAKYVGERGYEASIKWVGWPDGGPYTVGVTPEADWIADGVEDESNVVLLVSWYSHDGKANAYRRLSGHYVTVAGHMCAGRRERVIFVHDPERRTRTGLAYTVYRLTRLEDGSLQTGSRKVPELSATGFWSAGEKVLGRRRLVAIIDGAMRFRVLENSRLASERPRCAASHRGAADEALTPQ